MNGWIRFYDTYIRLNTITAFEYNDVSNKFMFSTSSCSDSTQYEYFFDDPERELFNKLKGALGIDEL